MRLSKLTLSVTGVIAAALFLQACEGGKLNKVRAKRATEIGKQYEDQPSETLFSSQGGLFSSTNPNQGADGGGNLGVNTYLWRATLDTVSFLPVTSADPFGGVIITDWYAPPETPNERFKLNVYVLGRALRADGLKVSVFRQIMDSQGVWRDANVESDTARKLEDAILTRARQLRNETRMMGN